MHIAHAQEISFKDTVEAYNGKRIKINTTGMKVLCSWGIANIAEGGIGYFTAKQDEWKYFHEMNALWGAVNTGIAVFSLGTVRKEMALKLSYDQSYDRYKDTKKLYLINAGLDVVYMAAGLGLVKYGETAKNNPAIFNGFGKSVVMQGAALFIFDNFMYSAHARYSYRWFQIMDEITLGANSIGIRHSFK